MVVAALVIALVAAVVAGGCVVALWRWRVDVHQLRDLANRLDMESRLEYLTTQTLGEMREAARRHFRSSHLP